MTADRPHVILRAMTMDDIDEVVEMDRLSFPTPWPARTYRYELLDNDRSTMQVIQPANGSHSVHARSGISGWWDRMMGIERVATELAGYSGMWHIGDEAHVSTIAVHPNWRGQKLGELLLWSMVRRAIQNNARMVANTTSRSWAAVTGTTAITAKTPT